MSTTPPILSQNDEIVNFYGHLRRGGGWSFFQAINGKKRVTAWVPAGAPFVYPGSWNGQYNIYFGVNPATAPVIDADRKRHPGKCDLQIMPYVASKNESICAVNALIAEFDGKDFTTPTDSELEAAYRQVVADAQRRVSTGELPKMLPEKALRNMAMNAAKDANFATSPDEYKQLAFEHVIGLPVRPSVLVASGGGLQAYWLLTEPYMINTPEERQFATDAQRRFTVAMGGDQSVKDLRRVLRVPGTYNVKPKYAPNYPVCNFVWCNLDLTYTIDQLLEVCPQPEPVQKAAVVATVHTAHKQQRAAAPVVDGMSRYAYRVAQAYNKRHNHKSTLLAAGYTDHGDRMSRPGEPDSRGVIVDSAKNVSYHFSGNDPLYSDHLRRPFDVVTVFDYAGDYEAAAVAIGKQLGVTPSVADTRKPGETERIIAHYRRLAEFADWSQIVPEDRHSANGYLTGPTDRKLFTNLLGVMERAGRVDDVVVSYRQLTNSVDSNGVKVAIASVPTAKNFLDRVNGVLLTYTTDKTGTVISLATVCSTFNTSNTNTDNEVLKVLQTGQLNGTTFRSHLADDAFAVGTARWAREVIDAEKSYWVSENPAYLEAAIAYKAALASKPETPAEMARLIGADILATYRELCQRSAEGLLPGLGTFGLLVVADLLDNPGADRQSIAQRRGLKVSSVTTALQKLVAWGLVETEQLFGKRKVYTLVGDVFGEIDERLPEARTYKLGIQRMDRQLEHMQYYAEKAAAGAEQLGDTERYELAKKRVERLATQREETVALLHPELDPAEAVQYAHTRLYTPPVAQAPDMPEPGQLAWDRWFALCNKAKQNQGFLEHFEYDQLKALTKVLDGAAEYIANTKWTEGD